MRISESVLYEERDFSGFNLYNPSSIPMPYDRCPKCGHAPLPADQSAPAACAACGVILAKIRAVPVSSRVDPRTAVSVEDAPLAGAGILGLFLHVPPAVDRLDWWLRVAALVFTGIWTAWIFKGIDIAAGEAGSYFLWTVLTPFHEAGHLLLLWAPQFVAILGGALGQHLMPGLLAAVLLIRRRDPFGAALFTWLLGYSFIMMAVYMYDAFDPRIMLLDGRTGADSDGHDWQNIFGDLGLLPRARGIGIICGRLGQAVMIACLAWATMIVWLQRAHVSDLPFAEGGRDA